MSLFGWGDQAKSAGEGVGHVAAGLDKLFTSADERLGRAEVIARLKSKPHEVMGEISKIEAASRSVWVSGWRPGIGWVCGLSLALYFIPQYLTGAYMFTHIYITTGEIIPYPVEPKAVLELVFLLLGLGAQRTVEKLGGKTK
jgi:hypothetical protein